MHRLNQLSLMPYRLFSVFCQYTLINKSTFLLKQSDYNLQIYYVCLQHWSIQSTKCIDMHFCGCKGSDADAPVTLLYMILQVEAKYTTNMFACNLTTLMSNDKLCSLMLLTCLYFLYPWCLYGIYTHITTLFYYISYHYWYQHNCHNMHNANI